MTIFNQLNWNSSEPCSWKLQLQHLLLAKSRCLNWHFLAHCYIIYVHALQFCLVWLQNEPWTRILDLRCGCHVPHCILSVWQICKKSLFLLLRKLVCVLIFFVSSRTRLKLLLLWLVHSTAQYHHLADPSTIASFQWAFKPLLSTGLLEPHRYFNCPRLTWSYSVSCNFT